VEGERRVFNRKNILLTGCYLVFSLLGLATSLLRPGLNWDVFGYVAAVRALETSDARDIHTFAYETVRASVPEAEFLAMAPPDGSGYKSTMRHNPAAFAEQLPHYRLRLLYVGPLFLLYKAGVNLVFATYLISGLAVCAGLWVGFMIVRRELSGAWLAALPPLAVAFGALHIARLSSPDGLAFLGVVLACGLFLWGRCELLIVLPALVAVRTELVLFSVPFLLTLLWHARFRRRYVAVSAAIAVLLYLGLSWHYRYPGWETAFYTLIEMTPYPLSVPHHVTPGQYMAVLMRGVEEALKDPAFMAYLAGVAAALFVLFERARRGGRWSEALREPAAALVLLCLLYVAVHFVLFPVDFTRFYAPFYLVGTLMLPLVWRGPA
jgi:hypothetical protein